VIVGAPSLVDGTGTVNRIAKFTATTTIGDSLLSDDGSNTTVTSGNLYMSTASRIDTVSSGTFNFGTSLATIMTFGRTGQNMVINSKLGIGTTSAGAMLHVNGEIFTNSLNLLANGLGLDTSTAGTLSIGTATATTISLGRTGQNVIVNSKVGISTSTPSANLDVNGNMFANFITVLANNLGLDTLTAGQLNIGSTTATSIVIGRSSITTTVPGTLKVGAVSTVSNCNSSASPAVCSSAPSGSVAMATGGSTLQVNTTAVTANSQIFIMEDSSLGTRLGITCNTTTGRIYTISARTAGSNFTIKSTANPATNKACLSYFIVN
jgi:hypothetical protein